MADRMVSISQMGRQGSSTAMAQVEMQIEPATSKMNLSRNFWPQIEDSRENGPWTAGPRTFGPVESCLVQGPTIRGPIVRGPAVRFLEVDNWAPDRWALAQLSGARFA